MDGTEMVIAAAAAFVGTHFLLSHPLRSPLIHDVDQDLVGRAIHGVGRALS